MAVITVRNLDDDVQRRLKLRAATNHRSMEAEARAILSAAVRQHDLARQWVTAVTPFGGADLDLPDRSPQRNIELT